MVWILLEAKRNDILGWLMARKIHAALRCMLERQERRRYGRRPPAHFWPFPAGDDPGMLLAQRSPDSLAVAVPGDVALSGRTSRPPGDQSRAAAARLGGHAYHPERAAGVCAGDSDGPGRLGGGAAVPRHGRRAGLSLAGGRGSGGA